MGTSLGSVESQVFLGGVSYDKADGGSSAITFMPPGVFQMETKMPFGISEIKLISDKNATCKIKGKNYKLRLSEKERCFSLPLPLEMCWVLIFPNGHETWGLSMHLIWTGPA